MLAAMRRNTRSGVEERASHGEESLERHEKEECGSVKASAGFGENSMTARMDARFPLARTVGTAARGEMRFLFVFEISDLRGTAAGRRAWTT